MDVPDERASMTRPPQPEPYSTADAVSMSMRRAGGYAWRLLAIGLVLAGAIIVVGPLQTVLMSLFFALLIAAWLMPLTNALARWMPRWLAAVISVVTFSLVVLAVFAFIGLSAASQWNDIWKSVESGVTDLNTWLRQGPLGLSDADILGYYQSAVGFVQSSSGDIAVGVLGGLGSIVSIATALAAGLFVLIFVLIQPTQMYGWLTGWLPSRNREVMSTAGLIAWNAFSQYSRGVVMVAVTNAAFVTILLLVMGVPLAIPLGVIVFLGAFIPYIGAPIAMLLAAFVALVTNGPLAGGLVVVLIFTIGQLEGNVLQPLILGRSVNIHPVAIVLVTAIGAAYFGIIGALIGVPVAAAIYGVMVYLRGPADEQPIGPAPARKDRDKLD
jgi:predicted PurR-regulated permease PerM